MKKSIRITKNLRLNELQNIAKTTLQIIEPFKVLSSNKLIITKKLVLFIDGMEKTKTKQNRRQINRIRGKIVTGLANQIKTSDILLRLGDHESSIPALNMLMQIFNKHAIGITRMPYDESTTAIENYIAQLKTLGDDFLVISSVAMWIPLLETANNNFKDFSLNKIDIITQENKVIAASSIANDLITALNELYTVIFAQLIVNPNPELKKAYNELSIMLDSL